jgi:orotidine-5'-phosphate decarboxylase
MKLVRLIPALDGSDLDEAVRLIRAVDSFDGVYGYKVGFSLGLSCGLPRVVEAIRQVSQRPVIYDHQKAATDIPDTGEVFARTLAAAGINEAILFPQAGPETLAAWTGALQRHRLKVIVGGIMTHPKYLASEGGFLVDERILGVYQAAATTLGVKAFVVPLTKPALVGRVVDTLGPSPEWEFYSPGFGKQGGTMAGFERLERHYVIIGRSLMSAPDPLKFLQATIKEATA